MSFIGIRRNPMNKLALVAAASLLLILSDTMQSMAAEPRPEANVKVGMLLVASEGMSDPRFAETVILIVQHDSEGTIGLVINKPSDIPLTHALPMLKRLPEGAEFVYVGGPVQFRSMMSLLIHSERAPQGVVRVFDNVYATTGYNNVGRVVSMAREQDEVRAFGGYAGWAPGQLDTEIARGGWRLFEADAKAVFARNPARIWRDYMEESGGGWDWVRLDGSCRDSVPVMG
ncbi:MAG: YqgE/AlgH family protein [Mariprofundaceae bacterium]